MLKIGLILSILFVIPGELIRLPIGPGNGLLLNDAFLPILIIAWLIHKITISRTFPKPRAGTAIIIFIGIAITSLIASLRFLETKEVIEGAMYLIRFIEYAALYFIATDVIKTKKTRIQILTIILGAAFLIAIAGFIQLKIYPDFRPMEDLGWDPHVNRLLSTWFDPNFVGGFLAYISCIVLGLAFHLKKEKPLLIAILTTLTLAIVLTYSRSSYLALAAGFGIIGTLKSRKFLLAAMIVIIIAVPFSERAQTRIIDTYHSAKSILTDTAETPDITTQHRLNSWKRAIDVYKLHPVLGVGYNNFKFVQSKEGLIMNINSHASTGSDSSLLTILATTGPFGLIAFLGILLTFLKNSFEAAKSGKTPLSKGLGLGIFGALISILIHSIFVNSLVFPNVLIVFWLTNALIQNQKMPGTTKRHQ